MYTINMNLRPYQQEYLDDITQGEKNLIHLRTGGGKTPIARAYVEGCIQKGQHILFLVSRNQILYQAALKHFGHIQNISIMQGNKKYELTDILCASIDTLARRPQIWPEIFNKYKQIIVDECHDTTAPKYRNFLDQLPNDVTVVGMTSTPYAVGKKPQDYWTKVIKKITGVELVKKEYLVFPKTFSSQVKMDTDVKKDNGGDYKNRALFEKNDDKFVYGSIVNEYIKHGNNQKAFCFAINIEHGKKIEAEFLNANINARHVDSTHDEDFKKQALHDFEHGDLQILINVNLYSTGTDIPCAVVGIMARPTASRILWQQQTGRLLRPYPGKKFAIILDHGGNTERLGHPLAEFEAETDLIIKKKNDNNPDMKTYQCKVCNYQFSEYKKVCPLCGAENETVIRKIKEKKDAELREIELKDSAEERRMVALNNLMNWNFTSDLIHAWNGDRKNLNEELRFICNAWDLIVNNKRRKPWGLFYKVWDAYPNTIYLKFPKRFIESKNEQIQKPPKPSF